MNVLIAFISLILLNSITINCQDYAEYARGAGMARRRNNR